MRFYIDTLGCKLNQADSEELSRNLVRSGAEMAATLEEANFYVLNTCSVTQEAERQARQMLRRAKKINGYVRVFATGCYARYQKAEIENIADIKTLHNISDITSLKDSAWKEVPIDISKKPPVRTRSMLKIQEGCDYKCTYCIVPSVRGRERSLPSGKIIDDVKTRSENGYKEVVLTGTRAGSYSDNGLDLRGLIGRILNETTIERIRLSSLQPQEISTGLLSLWQDKRLCRHFHIPLQSGSDRILQKMGRRYSAADFIRCIKDLRDQMPDANITTDLIVGFPEEGELEFNESLNLCQKAGFSKIHVFPYSPREGTPAAGRPVQVEKIVKRERSRQVRDLSEFLQNRYLTGCTGRSFSVLWETEISSDLWSGLTGNYIRVYCHSKEILRNTISVVTTVRCFRDGLTAELAPG